MPAVLLNREIPARQLVGEVAGHVEHSASYDERQPGESHPGKVAQRVHDAKYN